MRQLTIFDEPELTDEELDILESIADIKASAVFAKRALDVDDCRSNYEHEQVKQPRRHDE